jgi:hypothetical protein
MIHLSTFSSSLSWSGFGAANISFCEGRLEGPIAEPANAWSSMAYVVVGAWLISRAWGGRRAPLLLAGATSVLIGGGSFALHATATFLGQFLDEASMFLLGALIVTFALRRWLLWNTAQCFVHYLGLALTTVVLLALFRRSGIPIFALEIGAAIGVEAVLWQRAERGVYYGMLRGALLLFGSGFGIWVLDITRVACSTEGAHLLNGHALWHALTAASLAVYCRYQEQFFGSDEPLSGARHFTRLARHHH